MYACVSSCMSPHTHARMHTDAHTHPPDPCVPTVCSFLGHKSICYEGMCKAITHLSQIQSHTYTNTGHWLADSHAEILMITSNHQQTLGKMIVCLHRRGRCGREPKRSPQPQSDMQLSGLISFTILTVNI